MTEKIAQIAQGDVLGNRCPIHPALVTMPLALYPLSALLRVLGSYPGLLGGGVNGVNIDTLYVGAHYANLAAMLISVPAAITGYYESTTIPEDNTAARKTVLTHVALNTVVTLIGVFNWFSLRNTPGFEPTSTHVVAGVVAALLLWYSQRMGHKLVYEHGIGVKRNKSPDMS